MYNRLHAASREHACVRVGSAEAHIFCAKAGIVGILQHKTLPSVAD